MSLLSDSAYGLVLGAELMSMVMFRPLDTIIQQDYVLKKSKQGEYFTCHVNILPAFA